MSIVSDLSSTFSNLCMLAFPERPALAYKLLVFTSISNTAMAGVPGGGHLAGETGCRGRRGHPVSVLLLDQLVHVRRNGYDQLPPLGPSGTGGRLMLDDLPGPRRPGALAPGDARVLGRISRPSDQPDVGRPGGFAGLWCRRDSSGATIPDLPAPGSLGDGPSHPGGQRILVVSRLPSGVDEGPRSARLRSSRTRATATRGSSLVRNPRGAHRHRAWDRRALGPGTSRSRGRGGMGRFSRGRVRLGLSGGILEIARHVAAGSAYLCVLYGGLRGGRDRPGGDPGEAPILEEREARSARGPRLPDHR